MKKVIKLNEKDIENLVKRIIKEEKSVMENKKSNYADDQFNLLIKQLEALAADDKYKHQKDKALKLARQIEKEYNALSTFEQKKKYIDNKYDSLKGKKS